MLQFGSHEWQMKLSKSFSVSDAENSRGPSTVEGEICRQRLKSITSSSHCSRLGGSSITNDPLATGTPSLSVRPSSGTPSTRGDPRRSSDIARARRWCDIRAAACRLSSSSRSPVAALEMSSCFFGFRLAMTFWLRSLFDNLSRGGPRRSCVPHRSHHVLRTSPEFMVASGMPSIEPLAWVIREAMWVWKWPAYRS
eukprot:scaffold102147_cov29-Tisochrysis_lutea.AAC.3